MYRMKDISFIQSTDYILNHCLKQLPLDIQVYEKLYKRVKWKS